MRVNSRKIYIFIVHFLTFVWGISWVTCEPGSTEDQELDQEVVKVAQQVKLLLYE